MDGSERSQGCPPRDGPSVEEEEAVSRHFPFPGPVELAEPSVRESDILGLVVCRRVAKHRWPKSKG